MHIIIGLSTAHTFAHKFHILGENATAKYLELYLLFYEPHSN